jgi:DNA helicase-2/ATP-dependent DNA helicase PcrA
MSADDLLAGLDPEQRAAVTSIDAPLAIIAAAGSGKTTVLTRRIAHRVATGSALPRHVLALTFTRDAAAELKRRLRRLDMREPIEAGTFHSVALRLLRDRALANNRPTPHVANDRLRLVRECLTELKLRAEANGALADIDWARARLVDPQRYEAACRMARRRSAVPGSRFAELFTAYEQLKRRRGVVDFDDLLEGVLEALRTDRPWADGVRWRYRHFFVDEAQDLNPLQGALLDELRDGRPDLCLVGDPRQAIYGWNGADHTMLSDVGEHFRGTTVLTLSTNYRCSPQVVRAGAAALHASGQADDSRSAISDGPSIVVRQLADEHDEAASIVGHLRTLLTRQPGNRLAVLARTNEQVNALQRVLTSHGIPTERTAGRSPLDLAVRTAMRFMNREQLAAWVDTVFADSDTGSMNGQAALRVAEEADRFLTSGEPGTFAGWIDLRSPFDDLDDHRSPDAVALVTFHAAKGREWWGVVIAGVEDGLVPHGSASTPEQLAEEARLFYVAITRAEHHLLLTHCTSRGDRATTPSRWLPALAATSAGDEPVPPPSRERHAPPDPLQPFREWRAAIARASGQPEKAVCNDRVLRTLLDEPPASPEDLAKRLGITVSAAARLRPLPTG